MLTGDLYMANGPELTGERHHTEHMLARYSAIPPENMAERTALLRELLGAIGEGTVIQPPFNCDYGYNIRIGRAGFINYRCILLDCAAIDIGDNFQMAPMAQLYTAWHPIDPDERRTGLEAASPIRIGNDVWIGGGATVLPGVTIGDAVVVGAGAVVSRDVPPRVVVAGNPARVVRKLDRAS
ncbi:MAG: sugar O-acetyltransferase [Rhodospirillales bacterium]|nr:sugar O-acetyltransferase [Rhodospirillales bacterium]